MKTLKFSIRRSVIIAFIIVGSFSILSISVLWITTEFSEHQVRIDQFRESSMKAHKDVLKHEAERVISYINFIRIQNPSYSEQELQNKLLDYFASLHFKHGGYVFVNTYDGQALIFDGKRITEKKDITNLTDPDGKRLFDMELEASKKPDGDYMLYKFKRMDTTLVEHKISYIRGYDDWKWIIGAGLYLDKTLKEIELAELTYQNQLYLRILKIAALFAVLFSLFLVFGYILANYINKDFNVFRKFFNAAISSEARIDPKELRVSEFIKLSQTANKMIDNRLKDRKEIIEQRNTNQKYLDIVGVIILALDNQGNITLINKKGCEILGYKEIDLIGKNWQEKCLPKNNLMHGKNTVSEELEKNSISQIQTNQGETKTIEWHNMLIYNDKNQITGILSSGIDVTEKLKWQNELLESENKYRLLFEKTNDPVCIFDTSLNFTDCNSASLLFFGAENIEEIKGHSLQEFSLSGETDKIINFKAIIEEVLSNGFSRFEWEHFNMSGRKCYSDILLTLISISVENQIYAVIRDITFRAEYEQKLIEAREKAEFSDKLKTTFLNNMSHEVRTPLNTIMGFSQLLTQSHLTNSEIESYTASIMSSGENLTRIMDDIMDYSRYQAGEIRIDKELTDLKQLMTEVFLENYIQTARKPIRFTFVLPEPGHYPIIETDKKRLKQVLTHLLSNAMKFTDQGKVEYGLSVNNENIQFYVSDTGIGIEKQHLDSIFDKFNQVNHMSSGKIYGGTGLGLSISKAIVESMAGKIWVEKNPESPGSIFYFTIPISPVNNSNEELKTIVSKIAKSPIVFITNNVLTFSDFQQNISLLGLSAIHLTKGIDALNYCSQNPNATIVLVDFEKESDIQNDKSFPVLMAKLTSNISRIAVIGDKCRITKEMALINGYQSFIHTPFDKADVEKTLYSLIAQKKRRV